MNASIKGCLRNINRSYKAFEHKGERMTKKQVKAVLEYGLKKGYDSIKEISDNEVDEILENLKS